VEGEPCPACHDGIENGFAVTFVAQLMQAAKRYIMPSSFLRPPIGGCGHLSLVALILCMLATMSL